MIALQLGFIIKHVVHFSVGFTQGCWGHVGQKASGRYHYWCMQVANFHEEEETGLDVAVTYHASAAAPPVPEDSEAPPAPEPLGRCLVLPANIKFLPSLQVHGKPKPQKACLLAPATDITWQCITPGSLSWV